MAVICLGSLLRPLVKGQWQSLGTRSLLIFTGALIAYGLIFLDNKLQLWPALGLDYSTHTAVALVLVVYLLANSPKAPWFWLTSLVGYVLLMLYQRYHTVADIMTTAIVVAILYLPVVFVLFRKHRGMANNRLEHGHAP